MTIRTQATTLIEPGRVEKFLWKILASPVSFARILVFLTVLSMVGLNRAVRVESSWVALLAIGAIGFCTGMAFSQLVHIRDRFMEWRAAIDREIWEINARLKDRDADDLHALRAAHYRAQDLPVPPLSWK